MPSAVAGVIEISRCRRVITSTQANAVDISSDTQITVQAAAAERPADHDDDARERGSHRDPGAQGHSLSHQQPGEERRQEGRDRLEQQHVRQARGAEREDEATRGDRDADRHADARDADAAEGGERRAPAAHDEIRRERDRGRARADRRLGRSGRADEALHGAGRRPRDRGGRDEQLAASLGIGHCHHAPSVAITDRKLGW